VFSADRECRARLGELLGEAGFAQQPSAKNWSTTLVLDLRRSEDEIFASFSTLARRAIRAVAKGPLEVRPVDDAGFAHRLDALSGETFARTGAQYEARWDWAGVIELAREVPESSRLIGLFRTDRQGPDSPPRFRVGLVERTERELFRRRIGATHGSRTCLDRPSLFWTSSPGANASVRRSTISAAFPPGRRNRAIRLPESRISSACSAKTWLTSQMTGSWNPVAAGPNGGGG